MTIPPLTPDRAHLTALVMSEHHAAMAEVHAGLGAQGLALRERTKAVILYDRTLTHWSVTGGQPSRN